jgi:hypothetical protein
VSEKERALENKRKKIHVRKKELVMRREGEWNAMCNKRN